MVDEAISLQAYLARSATDALRSAVAEVVAVLAGVSIDVAELVSLGALAGNLGSARGRNADGDVQKDLDIRAHLLFRNALTKAPVAAFASEEAEELEIWGGSAPLCVAIDPVDGSGNIDLNMPVGTIFSVVPTPAQFHHVSRTQEAFAWPAGTAQLAAGFVVYGPQTTLALTLGDSVEVFTLDRRDNTFRLTRANLKIPVDAPDEYAINTSNYRHWEEPVRSYIDECQAGAEGPCGRDFNMRWHGALVAESHRILTRGGIYLYPSDARQGYAEGRLRLIYEAFPIAFLMECAGGSASSGRRRILDIAPGSLHQRVPFIFGSSAKVERLEQLHLRPGLWPPSSAPLFAIRGLFRT